MDLRRDNVSQALCCRFHEGYWVRAVEARAFLLRKVDEGKVRGRIADEDGKSLGWIDYYPRANGWVRIGCIRVPKENCGRGIGRALVNDCLDDCRLNKGVIVGATIWDHMPKGFFRKYGFFPIFIQNIPLGSSLFSPIKPKLTISLRLIRVSSSFPAVI